MNGLSRQSLPFVVTARVQKERTLAVVATAWVCSFAGVLVNSAHVAGMSKARRQF